ncbi:DUF4139 domain-containing protein [Kangiella sp.]|uniref:DUF4139 domain-containing protein n=1 Tax=Kangiella sp. TaxID=1920245 RepID=UPI003A94373D
MKITSNTKSLLLERIASKRIAAIRVVPAVIALALLGCNSDAVAEEQDAVTIYSSAQPGAIDPDLYRPIPGQNRGHYTVPGYGVVKSTRNYQLDKGQNSLQVTDVAAFIDPTTVSFRSLNNKHTRVLEQSYQFDLVNGHQLLQRFIGKTITVQQSSGDELVEIKGELLSADGNLVIKTDKGNIQTLSYYTNIIFPDLPEGLLTKPTLIWDLYSPASGEQTIELSYQTEGMTWWTDYNITYDESDTCKMDLSSWVSIINQSGASFNNAKLKLIAGDVNRAQQNEPLRVMSSRVAEEAMMDKGFEQKAFFEYHLYTLGRPADLANNSTKQLELFPSVKDVQCNKELVFDASSQFYSYYGMNTNEGYGKNSSGDVNVYLRFANEEKNALGIPLPAGRIRVNQRDTDGSLEFIGEDIIDHTPKNEDVLIKVGNAFDIKGERKQTDYKIDTSGKELTESFEITVKNHKDETVEVVVRENLYRWTNWNITRKSHDYKKQDSRHVHFNVKVPANGETKVTYTVEYSW